MTDREEFEKWYQDNCSDNHLSNEGYMFEEWLYLHKIIDECHRKIESQYNMIKSIQAYGEALQKTIDELKEELEAWKLQDEAGQIVINTLNEEVDGLKADLEDCTIRKLSAEQAIERLKAENPDVPCPACGGSGYDKNEDFNDALGKCGYCNQGKISEVKALQYENEQLKEEAQAWDEIIKAGK